MNSTYMSLEKVIRLQHLTSAERKKMLVREVKRYRRLKEQITLRKPATATEKTAEGVAEASSLTEQRGVVPSNGEGIKEPGMTYERRLCPDDTIVTVRGVLEELKQFIHEEFRALREELKEWRKP